MIKKADCHIHMVLDGVSDFRDAMRRHREKPDYKFIRKTLEAYADAGIYYLRDGGDKYGACLAAREIAPEYGISYLTPYFPIYKNGCYGKFIGEGFEYENDFYRLVKEIKAKKANFLKIMVSGIVDFDKYGAFIYDGPDAKTIKEMVHVGHEEGLKVMAHASGERYLEAVIEAGADSVEHGFYINNDCLIEMSERGTIWVPTISTVGNLVDDDRYPREVTKRIFDEHMANVAKGAAMGVSIACGSDAGAYRVPHVEGAQDEMAFLKAAIGDNAEKIITEGNDGIFKNFV